MSNQNVATPEQFVKAIENHLGIRFKYDLAADAENKKAAIYYDEYENSLAQEWPTDGWCWLNPPFKKLTKWINKCEEQAALGSKIVSIWPLSGDANCIPVWRMANVYIIHGRVWSQVRSCMVCVWGLETYRRGGIEGLVWDRKKAELKRAW
jgi:phage N-6-adenine-methyltransferase